MLRLVHVGAELGTASRPVTVAAPVGPAVAVAPYAGGALLAWSTPDGRAAAVRVTGRGEPAGAPFDLPWPSGPVQALHLTPWNAGPVFLTWEDAGGAHTVFAESWAALTDPDRPRTPASLPGPVRSVHPAVDGGLWAVTDGTPPTLAHVDRQGQVTTRPLPEGVTDVVADAPPDATPSPPGTPSVLVLPASLAELDGAVRLAAPAGSAPGPQVQGPGGEAGATWWVAADGTWRRGDDDAPHTAPTAALPVAWAMPAPRGPGGRTAPALRAAWLRLVPHPEGARLGVTELR